MIARFTDHKALAFAYSDLLAAGVPSSAMCETRHRAPLANHTDGSYLRFLSSLSQWIKKLGPLVSEPRSRRHDSASSVPGVHWAALQIEAPGHEETVFGVIAHRQGTLTF